MAIRVFPMEGFRVRRWGGVGGVGWDIDVLTTTSLILRCQHMFHQL